MSKAASIERVLLVDDQPLMRESVLRHVLNILPGAHVAVADTGAQAIQHCVLQPVDLVIAELFLSDMHSFALLQRLQASIFPNAEQGAPLTVLLACGATTETQATARRLRVHALLNKRIAGARLEQALAAVCRGERVFEAFQSNGRSTGYHGLQLDLTAREFEVLLSLARGLSNKQIESALAMSASTLKTHMRALFDKFAVSNRTACLVSARHAGFL